MLWAINCHQGFNSGSKSTEVPLGLSTVHTHERCLYLWVKKYNSVVLLANGILMNVIAGVEQRPDTMSALEQPLSWQKEQNKIHFHSYRNGNWICVPSITLDLTDKVFGDLVNVSTGYEPFQDCDDAGQTCISMCSLDSGAGRVLRSRGFQDSFPAHQVAHVSTMQFRWRRWGTLALLHDIFSDSDNVAFKLCVVWPSVKVHSRKHDNKK